MVFFFYSTCITMDVFGDSIICEAMTSSSLLASGWYSVSECVKSPSVNSADVSAEFSPLLSVSAWEETKNCSGRFVYASLSGEAMLLLALWILLWLLLLPVLVQLIVLVEISFNGVPSVIVMWTLPALDNRDKAFAILKLFGEADLIVNGVWAPKTFVKVICAGVDGIFAVSDVAPWFVGEGPSSFLRLIKGTNGGLEALDGKPGSDFKLNWRVNSGLDEASSDSLSRDKIKDECI